MAQTKGHAALHAQLDALRQEYVQELPAKLAAIAATWAQLCTTWEGATAATLQRQVHGLTGSGAMYGFPELTDAARALEDLLEAASERSDAPTASQRSAMEHALDGVKSAVATAQAACAAPSVLLSDLAVQDAAAQQPIVVLSPDPISGHDLATQIGHYGYPVEVVHTREALCKTMAHARLAAIILDTAADAAAYAEVSASPDPARAPAVPLIVISDRRDLGARLQAVRADSAAYFVKPVNVGALIDTLDTLTTQRPPEPYRILIVDDEPLLAAYCAATLRHAGMQTASVVDPMQIMQPLEEFRPDLILMDMYMPGCTGLELAAVLRQQEAFVSVPIVFLSAERNVEKQLAAMSLGGDDFLTKPIQPDHLVSAVRSRMQRSRTLRSFMIRDSLTGLLNHTSTREQIDLEVARAKRRCGSLTLAMLDIDHFKAVNDTYGHPVGDRVIKSLARLLQQRLRRTDIVGRYGGEEFAVAMLDVDGPTAVKVMNQLRAGFAQIRQQSDQGSFYVTFSCGVASMRSFPDPGALSDAADKALYAAKRAGRNRVVLADDLTGAHEDQPTAV
jgi:diguanylate cyclase (GGDEF)-like protein